MTNETVPRHGLHNDTRPRLHCVMRRLLQCRSSRITKVHDWQATTSDERCSTSRHRYTLSSTTVCHDSCTTICTGLTLMNVSNTRLASQCTAVCRVTCLYHVTVSVPSAVKPSLLQARRSGTLYRTVSETRLSAAATSGNYLRRTSSTVTQHTQRSRDAVWLCAI